MNKITLLTAFLFSLCAFTVNAQSPTAPALAFNVFTLHGATLITNETEGPVAIGTDLTLASNGSYQVSTNQVGTFQLNSIPVTLVVGGKIIYSGGNGLSVNSNGYVKIGDSTNSYVWYTDQNNAYSPIRITPGNNYNGTPKISLSISSNNSVFGSPASSTHDPIFQSNVISFASAFSTMQASSTSISTCTDNAYITDANGNPIPHTNLPNQVKITLNGGTNTLNLTGSDMNNVQNFTFNNSPDASHVLVINVNASGTFNWSAWTNGGVSQSNCPYILYNFYNTTTLNIQGNGAVEGTVFAPYADITKSANQSNIEGQVIGLSYYHSGGENHYAVFSPSVSGCGTPTVAGFTINNNSQCLSGNSFTFTNTSTGSSLTYAWNFGDNTSSTSANPPAKSYSNAGVYNVKLVVTGTGGKDSVTHSVTVTANVTPSVSIAANPGSTICSGTSVTFTATPTNGGTPSYQWKKNGVNVGTNSSIYTDAGLANTDVITCVMTSTATCASPANATSNAITMTVNSNLTPSVSIAANPGTTICSGASVTFTATPTNGGTPSYQWKLNGNNVGSNSNTYTNSSLNNSDAVSCVMTSNAACASPATATSNTLTMTVNTAAAEPAAFTTSSATTYQGQTGVTYTVPNVGGITYAWSYSGTGATINGSGNSVTVSFSTSATSGSLCVTASNGSCGVSASRCVSVTVKPYITWNCSTSNDWNTASNWDAGFVPYSTISVLIPSGVCNPNICSANASANNVTINSGATVNICCSMEMDVKGNLTNNGSVLGCGKVVMVDSCHTIYGKGRVDNFELRSGCAVCNTTINNGDTMHIGKTYLPTSGTLLTNGGLELLSDSTTTAVVLAHGNACGTCNTYISGDVTLDKYIHGGQRAFRFFGHPFTSSIALNQLTPYIDITGQGGAANGFSTTNTNNPSAFWYNTLTGNGSASNDSSGWTAFTNTNGAGANAWNPGEGVRILVRGTLGQGLGCSLCVPSPVTVKIHGPLDECSDVVTCATNANVGYNFISNPYPSNIDLSLCTRASSVGANFAVWDPNQGVYGAYVSQPFNVSYILPSMSAFFTTCTANTNNTITFHESDKTSSAPTGSLFKTTSGFGNDVVQLHILSNNDSVSWDRLLLFFNGQALAAADPLDGTKIYNPGLSFYSFSSDAQQLSIDQRPYSYDPIQLGIQNADQQDYVIRVDNFDVQAGTTLFLHDKYLNQVMPLAQGMRYNFTVSSDPASQGDQRFEINMTPLGIQNVNGNSFNVSMAPNPATDKATISFNAPAIGNTSVRVMNIMGQEVYANELGMQQSANVTLPLQGLASGIYLVTVKCGDLSVTKRLVKQ